MLYLHTYVEDEDHKRSYLTVEHETKDPRTLDRSPRGIVG